MGQIFKQAITGNQPFWVLTIVAILLIVVAFFLPPTAIVDKSILTAVGELMGFGALWAVVKAMDKGVDAKLTHRNTTLEIGDKNDTNNNISNSSEF